VIVSLHDAARRRLARLRGEDAGDDAGFAMIFVLVITMLITIGVSSALVITASNVVPAKHSQDDVAALAAAQAGLDDYVAYLNANCATFNSQACPSINGTSVSATVNGTDNAGTETYVRTVLNPSTYLTNGFLRVKSTGRSQSSSKTLVADLAGLPNVLRFAYMSKYETLASTFVNSYYPARTVAITKSASATAANTASPALSTGSSVGWSAPSGTDICDKLWYDDTSNPTDATEANAAGADLDPAYQNPGRGTVKTSYRTGLPIGADWSQSSTPGSTNPTLYQPCEVNFTSGMTFTGPVYSRDAVYLSYGTSGGAGPTFIVPAAETLPPVSTGWATTSFPSAVPGQLYRQFPYILGAPSISSTLASTNNTVQTSAYDLQLPTDVVDAAGSATCTYTGPTRIVVTGATATIISPLTTATGSACYTNTASGYSSPISATGVTSAQVPISSTTIYVQNKGTGATTVKGSAANPIISLSTPASSTTAVAGTPTVTATDAGYTPSTTDLVAPSGHTDGAWTPRWPSYSLLSDLNAHTPTCSGITGVTGSLTSSADLQFFNCNVPHSGYADSYSYVKAALKSALAVSPSSYTTPTTLAALANSLVGVKADGTLVGDTSDWNQGVTATDTVGYPTYSSSESHRYNVTAVTDAATTDGCDPTATTTTTGTPTPVARPTSDKFLSTATTGYTTPTTQTSTSCMTATVRLQIGMKNSADNSNPNSCNQNNCGWGDGTTLGGHFSQFRVTAKVVTPSTTSNTTSTVVAFPDSQDATQYSTWDGSKTNAPGDLYVEGTGITSKLSLVAQNDVVVTGPLTTATVPANAPAQTNTLGENTWVSGGAVSLVAKNNVRLYHPVSCADTASTATTLGYCPNDITGIYSTGLESNGTLAATHPAMQYCNMTTGYSANTGNTTNCPTVIATGTGAVTDVNAAVFALNGSLMTDNYNRGVPMLNASGNPITTTVLGGIYQLHRGATGQQWESQAADTTRASSGYILQNTYFAMDSAGLPYVPALKSGKSNRSWNIVSVSAGS
jgi:Tfp pilus assembly protein PilX